MEPTTVIGIVTIVGALMGTVVPYAIKAWQDPEVKFDVNYGYTLLIGVTVQAVALLPDDVPALTVKGILTAFGSGYGIQSLINRVTPKKS